ncbi:N-acetylglucosamine-6-phosphate deacetylase [Gracilibacillus kekensis]|uniref:N-acetylglucosamine-6-phosphate deacetylase n=1 Tax=Gracilibacillus kekensis TaxID=1027249 RepID=A0A1M7QI44_9BACI|nr:N-acetylglucosamine-6-phosphate deacetylase [Gracilibacillus kekensis]SHN30587.1 N-acetylglucosamine-6-phosphate deacetylase [Gracilibacillus kekensis]
MKKSNLILANMKIFSENTVISKGYIKIKRGKITEIGEIDDLNNQDNFTLIELDRHFKAIPGLIDIHIHGANGSDVMDATPEAIHHIATALPQEGTTCFLATTMTQNEENIEHALQNVASYMNHQADSIQAEVLGVHLEGPFINPERAGAQPKEHIQDPNLSLFRKWNTFANQNIKLVTLAPEQSDALSLIHYLHKEGIIASIGHSNATYHEALTAIEHGLSHVTHLYNQMRGFHHRDPGVVGAAWLQKQLTVEIIADGLHVTPDAIQIAYNQLSANRLILITDSMRAKYLPDGSYDLGGQTCTVQQNMATLKDGTLAGSTLKLSEAFQNIMNYTNCSIQEAIQMTSVNPAKKLDIFDRKGSLAIGKDADIVILDEQNQVVMTICKGNVAFTELCKTP